MWLEFFNTPPPAPFPEELGIAEKPQFTQYEPDWDFIARTVTAYDHFDNLLVIGHGGSITSLYGIYYALHDQVKKKIYFLSTVDPDDIFEVKRVLRPTNTLVIAISKSGETITQLEALFHFLEFPLLFITNPESPLGQIAARLNGHIIEHPAIGGRYTGMTEVALLPAALCGLPITEIFVGAHEFYSQFGQDNLAWQAASIFWQLEQRGYTGVFLPFYSHYLFPFNHVIVQLCHESFGKQGRGQIYFAHEGPESQHHTNQRFFGGAPNLIGFLISMTNFLHESPTVVPPQLHSINLKNQQLQVLHNIPLGDSLRFELQGTMEDAKIKSIPLAHLTVSDRSAARVGEFLAFWRLYALYGAILRDVNAFDQPQVEASKEISFNKRLGYKGLL